MTDIDGAIDRLYQTGLDVFVAERNALAKAAKRADVKALEKPSVPAWAVNQLFWHDRAVFDRLVAASEAVRAAHRALLEGQAADVRGAETAHREALREAVTAAKRHLSTSGAAASPSTMEAVTRTLEALPHPEANGRLVKPLTPAGLDALAGLTVAARVPTSALTSSPGGPAGLRLVKSQPTGPDGSSDAEAARPSPAEIARQRAALAERRQAAMAALADARAAVTTVETQVGESEARLAHAERELATRRRELEAAREWVSDAEATLRDLPEFL